MTKFAVHNYHSPAVEIDAEGNMCLDGKTPIPLGMPLYTAATFEKAEAWREANRPTLYAPRDTKTVGSDRNQ